MKNRTLIIIADSMLSLIIITLLLQGSCFSQEDQSSKKKDHKNPQTLTVEQAAQIKTILSQYNASTLTAEDAKGIHAKFRQAGIHAGPETREAILAAGFDPEKLRSLDPPPEQNNKESKTPDLNKKMEMVEEIVIPPLSLDSVQILKVKEAFIVFFTEVEKIKKSQANPQEQMDKSLVQPVEKTRDEKIKLVLSKEQYSKYLELEKASRPNKNREKETQKN